MPGRRSGRCAMAGSASSWLLAAVLLAGAGAGALAASSGSSQARRVAPCFWASGTCQPTALTWFVPSSQPSSLFHRVQMLAVERAEVCAAIRDRASCMANQRHRCFWIASLPTKCQAADAYEVKSFLDSTFAPTLKAIPAAMTCPGSLAREFFTCNQHPAPPLCKELPGCQPMSVPGLKYTPCFPKWYVNAGAAQQAAVRAQIAGLDASFFGNCAGTCWLKQSAVCLDMKKGSECTNKAFCRWDTTAKVCFHKIWAADINSADKEVSRLHSQCYGSRSAGSCEGHGAITLTQYGRWADQEISAKPVTCSAQVQFERLKKLRKKAAAPGKQAGNRN